MTFGEAGCVGEGNDGEESGFEQIEMHDGLNSLSFLCLKSKGEEQKERRTKGGGKVIFKLKLQTRGKCYTDILGGLRN